MLIELVRLQAWGDLIMSTATFPALKQQGARLRVVTSTEFASLLQAHPLVDDVVSIPKQKSGNTWRAWQIKAAVAKATRQYPKPTRQILLQNHPNWNRFRQSLNTLKPGWGDHWPPVTHQVQAFAQQVGVLPEGLSLHLPPVAEAWGQEVARHTVLLQAQSSNPNKDWPAERWSELAAYIQQEWGLPVAQLGKPCQASPPGVQRLAAPNMMYALGAVKACRLFIGPDSAFNHACEAFGKQAIILFGQSHPAQYSHERHINFWQGQRWQQGRLAQQPKTSDWGMHTIRIEQIKAAVEACLNT